MSHTRTVVCLLAMLCLIGQLLLPTAGGTEIRPLRKTPQLLPTEIDDWADPMPESQELRELIRVDLAKEVWEAIDLQFREQHEEAIGRWNCLQLPGDADFWRQLALSEAHLATGNLHEADLNLHAAARLRPDNPVVHYLTGLLRLKQAYLASDWYDAIGPTDSVLVSHQDSELLPKNKSWYRLAAIREFRHAIQHASAWWPEEPIVPADWPTLMAESPTANDLLLAMRAENFVPRSHGLLGNLLLESGNLAVAERHLDQAVEGGVAVTGSYVALGEAYEELEQHSDACRAFMKAAEHEANKLSPLRRALDNLRQSIF